MRSTGTSSASDHARRSAADLSSGQTARVCHRSKTTARTTSSSCLAALRGFVLARVETKLEHPPKALAGVRWLEAEVGLATQDLHRVLRPAPPVAALVALSLGEHPEPLHLRRTLGRRPDGTCTADGRQSPTRDSGGASGA